MRRRNKKKFDDTLDIWNQLIYIFFFCTLIFHWPGAQLPCKPPGEQRDARIFSSHCISSHWKLHSERFVKTLTILSTFQSAPRDGRRQVFSAVLAFGAPHGTFLFFFLRYKILNIDQQNLNRVETRVPPICASFYTMDLQQMTAHPVAYKQIKQRVHRTTNREASTASRKVFCIYALKVCTSAQARTVVFKEGATEWCQEGRKKIGEKIRKKQMETNK